MTIAAQNPSFAEHIIRAENLSFPLLLRFFPKSYPDIALSFDTSETSETFDNCDDRDDREERDEGAEDRLADESS